MATLGNTKTFLLQNTEIIMPKNIDDVIKEVVKNNKDLHTLDARTLKDIKELKTSIKKIDDKIKKIDETLQKAFSILQDITVVLDEVDEHNDYNNEENDESEEWTPYDDRNFDLEEEDDDEDEEAL